MTIRFFKSALDIKVLYGNWDAGRQANIFLICRIALWLDLRNRLVHLVYLVDLVDLVCLVRRYFISPEIILAVLSAYL